MLTRLASGGTAAAVMLGVLVLVSNRIPLLAILPWAAAALLVPAHLLLQRKRPGVVAAAVAAVWSYWILSYLLTLEPLRGFFSFEFHRRDGQIFFSLLPLALVSAWGPTRESALRLVVLICAPQALVALAGFGADFLGQRAALEGLVYLVDFPGYPANYCGLYRAHNAAGSVQGLCSLVAATMAAFAPQGRRRWAWGAMALCLLWGVLLSESRGALLAFAGAAAILGFRVWRERGASVRVAVAVVLALLVTAAIFGPRASRRMAQLGTSDGTHTDRWLWWKRGIEEWSWSPIVGEGMGRYNDKNRQWSGVKHLFYVVTEADVVNNAAHAHNSFVHFLAEGGLAGFGITVGLWACMAWKLRKAREPIRIAAFVGILYLFAISMTEHYMGGGAMLLVLSCLAGAAWSLPDPAPADKIAPS